MVATVLVLMCSLYTVAACPMYTGGDLPLTSNGRVTINTTEFKYIQVSRVSGSGRYVNFYKSCDGTGLAGFALLFSSGFNIQHFDLHHLVSWKKGGHELYTCELEDRTAPLVAANYQFTARSVEVECNENCTYPLCKCDIDGGLHCVAGFTNPPLCDTQDGSGMMVDLSKANLTHKYLVGEDYFSIPAGYLDFVTPISKTVTRHGDFETAIMVRREYSALSYGELESQLVGEERLCCSAVIKCRLYFQFNFVENKNAETTAQYLNDVPFTNAFSFGTPVALAASEVYETCQTAGVTEGLGEFAIATLQASSVSNNPQSSATVNVKVDTQISLTSANNYMQQIYGYNGALFFTVSKFPVVVVDPVAINATLTVRMFSELTLTPPKLVYDGIRLSVGSWGTLSVYVHVFVKVGATAQDIPRFTSPDVMRSYIKDKPDDIMIFTTKRPIQFFTKGQTTVVGCLQADHHVAVVCEPMIISPRDLSDQYNYKALSLIIGLSAVGALVVGAIVIWFRNMKGQIVYESLG